MKSPLIQAIEAAAHKAVLHMFENETAEGIAAARADGWQDPAIEACVDFGLTHPDSALSDAFVTAFIDQAEKFAEEEKAWRETMKKGGEV